MKLYLENQKHETFAEANWYCDYVYAHGDLEEMAGYDILCYQSENDFDYINDRIEDITVILPNGTEVESTLFFWHSQPNSNDEQYNDMIRLSMKKDPVMLCHGLVVAKTDKRSLRYAKNKYVKSASFI